MNLFAKIVKVLNVPKDWYENFVEWDRLALSLRSRSALTPIVQSRVLELLVNSLAYLLGRGP